MSTTSKIEERQKSYFAPGALALKLAKALEAEGATPEEINGMSQESEFLREELERYRNMFFDLHEIFKNRDGLWRSDDFENFILSSVAQKTKKPSLPSRIVGFDLPEDMIDKDIRKSLGDNHVFEASEGCAIIAGMISRQAEGQDGDLLINGRANIFYVRGKAGEVFAVYVYWPADGRRWRVRAYRLDDGPWPAGHRAFSRNSIFDK